MKVAQLAPLIEAIPPKLYGGAERAVHWLTEELVRIGVDVDLYATADSQTSAQLIACSDRGLRLDGRMGEALECNILMIENMLRCATKYDIIHSHIGCVAFPQFRHWRLPALTTVHGLLAPIISDEFREMPLVSNTHAQRGRLPLANWVANIHYGMPEGSYSFVEGPDEYLLFLGRISPQKGLDSAIEIARRVGIHLKVAAMLDPADRDYFERHIASLLEQPGVEFLGEVNDAQKQELMGNARALLFPIRWPEPFGTVMIEAMACGTPVIAFRRGAVPEIIEDGLNGFICDDVDAAVECIGRLKQVSRAECRRVFEERFTARIMAQNYLRLYEDFSSHRAKPGGRPYVGLSPEENAFATDEKNLNPPLKMVLDEEMVRTFDPPAVDWFEARKIEFEKIYTPTECSTDCRLLATGWSEPESWGAWTIDEIASIELGCDVADGDSIELTLQVRTFVTDKKPKLRVTCRINNSKSVEWEFTQKNWQCEKSITITAQEWREKRPARLVFEIHDPASPHELGLSPDNRRIGLGISSIKVRRVSAAMPASSKCSTEIRDKNKIK